MAKPERKDEIVKIGRPPRPVPERIPDTPDNIMRALVESPPKERGDWDYLKKPKSNR